MIYRSNLLTQKECMKVCKQFLDSAKSVTTLEIFQRFDTLLDGDENTPAILDNNIAFCLLYQIETTCHSGDGVVHNTFGGYFSMFGGEPFSEAYPRIYYFDRVLTEKYSEAKIWVEWTKRKKGIREKPEGLMPAMAPMNRNNEILRKQKEKIQLLKFIKEMKRIRYKAWLNVKPPTWKELFLTIWADISPKKNQKDQESLKKQ